MYLENLVFDAVDPRRLGRFWEAALGASTLSDGPEGFETRLSTPGGPDLDLCFQPVARPCTDPPRVSLDLRAGASPDAVVDQLLELGATHRGAGDDAGSAVLPAVVLLADPEGHAFRVVGDRLARPHTGPLAAVTIRGADHAREAAFWADLTGWVPSDPDPDPADQRGDGRSLRHPSGRGPVLQFLTEDEPKRGKNRLHLDLRLEPGDQPAEVLERALSMGAARVSHDFGELPWTLLTDPAGNELCLLPERAA